MPRVRPVQSTGRDVRIGVVSDIHGNHRALARAIDLLGPIDRLLCVGDAINQHRFSNEVVAMLRDLDATTIWGNHEAAFFGPGSARLREANWIDRSAMQWLEERQTIETLELAGRRLLLVHSTPRQPFGNYVSLLNGGLDHHFADTGADVILCGHTHRPDAVWCGQTLVLNPGSAGEGMPRQNGYILSCAVLDLETLKHERIEFRD